MISQINIAAYQTTPKLNKQNNNHVVRLTEFGEEKIWKITKAALLYSMIPGSRKWVSKSPSSFTSGGFPWLTKGQDWLEHLRGVLTMLISYMDSEGSFISSELRGIVCGQNSHKPAQIEEEIWFPNLMVALLVYFGCDNKLP